MRSSRPLVSVNSPSGTFSRLKLYAAVLAASQWMVTGEAWAAPEGGEVVGGEGIIQQAGVETLITQATERMAIDWRSFDVAANERVEFVQPSSSSIALNRVLSNRGSEIMGRIDANGQVMLVNPNGIVFGKDSVVNVGGMIASGLNIDPTSFINGEFALDSIEGAEGKVINYGIINAAIGGSVTLVGEQVQNDGLISAKLGAVNLVAGNAAVLTFDPSGMMGVKVSEAVVQDELGVDAAVINNGSINAEGGRVLLNASVSEDVFTNAVNNAGMNKASSVVVHEDGSFTLGAGADVINTGDISTSVTQGDAGQVVMLGENITHSGKVIADAGSGTGGSIELHSADTTSLTADSIVSAQAGARGEGGDIKVLGNKVGLFDKAEVNASGANGGGQVLVGGDKTGQNQQVRNADFIYLGKETHVKTDALAKGDGGKLITFASDSARIHGNLSARGGSQGGDGGFIETSGLKGFEILNTPDMGATAGEGGTWLIDPNDIIIKDINEEFDGFPLNSSPFISTSNSELSISSVENALDNGTVIVRTGNSGGTGLGNITLEDPLNYSFGGVGAVATLQLEAYNDIYIKGDIKRAGGNTDVLNIVLKANYDESGTLTSDNDGIGIGSGSGSISIDKGKTINTGGGSFSASGVGFSTGVNSGNATVAAIATNGGNVTLAMTGAINLGSDILTLGGNFTATGTSFSAHNPNSIVINTSTGNLTITANSTTHLGNIIANNLTINADGDLSDSSPQAGNLSVTQETGTKLTIAGSSTFNTHVANADNSNSGGDVTLNSLDNIFAGSLLFSNTGSVSITDASAVNLDTSNISGNFTLTTGGNISQSGAIVVSGTTSFNSIASVNNYVIDLSSTNNFGGTVSATNASALTLVDTNDLTLSALTIVGGSTGNIDLTAGAGNKITLNGNLDSIAGTEKSITLRNNTEITSDLNVNAGTGAISVSGTINSNDATAKDLTLTGGNIVLSGNMGDTLALADVQINSSGQVTVGATNINSTTFAITGAGTVADSLLFSSGKNNWALTGANSGTVQALDTNDNPLSPAITFSGIQNITGGSGEDHFVIEAAGTIASIDGGTGTGNTITGRNIANTWEISGSNQGTVTDGTTAYISQFTNIQNLIGGSANDNFNFSILAAAITGSIHGGAGEGGGVLNSLTGKDVDSTWTITNSDAGNLSYLNSFTNIQNLTGGSAADIFNFSTGTAAITGTINGGAAAEGNAIEARAGAINTWLMSGNEAGSIALTADLLSVYVNNFNHIHVFTGAGSDTMSFENIVADTVKVTLGATGSTGITTFIGNNGPASEIIKTSGDNVWTITGVNQGTIDGITFSQFQNLTGGTGIDTFDFSSALAEITGKVDGGGSGEGNTIIARTGMGVRNTWSMSGEGSGGLTQTDGPLDPYLTEFSDIQIFTGAGADTMSFASVTGATVTLGTTGATGITHFIGGTASTLIGENKSNTWLISNANSGSINFGATDAVTFSNFETITGGSQQDIFDIDNAFSGVIKGGDGADIFNVNAAAQELLGEAGNDQFVFTSAANAGTAFNIDGGTDTNTLIGRNENNTWTVNGINSGSLQVTNGTSYITSFSNIQILNGGSGNDIFTLNNIVSGSINAGIGTNTFNVNAAVGSLTGGDGDDNFVFGDSGSATSINGGNGINQLTARNGLNTWNLNATNAGSLQVTNASDSYINNFTNIQTLLGGNNVDIFNITQNFTGTLRGNNGGDIFNINASVDSLYGGLGNDSFRFNNVANAGFAALIDGGGDVNDLMGRNSASIWTMTAENAGNVGLNPGALYVSNFNNIQSLIGGSAADTFAINAALSNTIDAGSGDNTFTINAAVGSLIGGDGNDSFIFSNAGSVDIINGAGGSNTLWARDSANTWTLTADNQGSLAVAGTSYVSTFYNIHNLQGGTGTDLFNLNFRFDGTVSGGDGDDTFTVNAQVFNLLGGGDNDSFLFPGVNNLGIAAAIDGGTGINGLTGRSAANSWIISAVDTGSLAVTNGATYVTSFASIQTLNGGNDADTYIINANVSNGIFAGAGNNTFRVNTLVGSLTGGVGDDWFIFGSTGAANLIDGGLGSNTLAGRDTANTWTLTAANVGSLGLTNGANYVNNFSNIQVLQGGITVDIFNLKFGFSGTAAGGADADIFNVDAITNILEGGEGNDSFVFSSNANAGKAESIDGGSGDNQIVGRNATNTWSITGENSGKVSITSGAAYVTNFNHIQTLIGGTLADVFEINANVTGGIKAGNGNNIFKVNTDVSHLQGGDDNDEFIFGVNGRANSVNGGVGTNSLYGRNANNLWTITSPDAGNIRAITADDLYVTNFYNIQALHGGKEADQFNINAAAVSIYGNDGNDVFSFAESNNGTANLIDGGLGSNSLRGRNQATRWTMTGVNSGSVSNTAPNIYVSSFVNINTLVGSSDADTLAGVDQSNSWLVTDDNEGELYATATPAEKIIFQGMENLLGNQSVDLFVFTANGNITGLIDGGTSATKDVVKDALDLSALTGNLMVALGNQQTAALNVVNVEDIIASTNNQNNHVLIGANDTAYRWKITGENQGVVETAVNPLLETSVNFTNFGDIRGGSNSDRFDVQGTITKSIDGGNGIDLVDYSQRKENFTIEIGGSGGLGDTGINGIEGVVGNSDSGTGYTSTIKVNSGDNIWEIGAASNFGDGNNDGSITINNNKISFENFTNLIGGSGRDTFNYIENGQWIGNISGGGGTNIIDASLSLKNQQFGVFGTALSTGTNLSGINEIIGNADTDSLLVSNARANTWQIDNQANGRLNDTLAFTNIANLQGGVFSDTFNIANLSWLQGVLDGGGGSGVDTVNLMAMGRALQVAMDAQTEADINVLDMEAINANNSFANTLKAGLNDNEWHINGLNAGVFNNTINFTGFANLMGNSLTDLVVFDNSAAALTGHIDLGDGQDVLDLSSSGRDMTVQLNTSRNSLAAGILSIDNIEDVKGDANQSNRLIGDNYSNTWILDNVDAGRVSATETGTITFSQFKHITGGTGDDLFVFEALGKITGLVDGGTQVERDSVDLSKSNDANVVVTSSGGIGFTNVERYIGNNIDSTFTAADVINNWLLTGTNRGTLNDVIEFENFGVLKGGSRQDNFIINNATISGSIDAGDGDDTFNIQTSAIAGKIMAGRGDDRFTFMIIPDAEGTADIDGGEGVNRLTTEGGEAEYKSSHQPGHLEYVSATTNTYSILYSNVANIFDNVVADTLSIFGTTTADTFRLQTGRYNTNNLATVNYTNKSNLIVNGSADDQVIVDGTVGVESTITFNNLRVLAENAGKIQARSLALVNTGNIGSATARLNTAVNELSLNATNGGIYLEEQDGLVLGNFNVSTTDRVDIKAGGNLSTSGALAYSGNLTLESLRGDIALGSGNSLTGTLNLKAAGDITLDNLQALSLGDLSAQNASLSSGTSIQGLGIFSVAGLATLNAVNDISLLNTGNDINQINIGRADALALFDKNGFTATNVNVTNDASLRSSGGIILGASCSSDCFGINAKNLQVQSDASVTVAKNISAAESIEILSQGIVVNDSITSKQFLLNAANGKLVLNESGNLLGEGGSNIELIANTIEQHSTIVGGGNITVNATGDIVMTNGAVIESLGNNINLNGNNLQLALLKANSGVAVMTAQGAITDGNGTAVNIISNGWQADAMSGIGVGLGEGNGADAIETDIGVLSVRNAGKAHLPSSNTSINIANANSLIIEQARNNGHISISNANGDVVLDNTNNDNFNPADLDARTQGGVINTNTGSGGQLFLTIGNGMVRAENKANKQNPDVIADIATFNFQSSFDFGERNRKIIMHVPEIYNQNSRLSFVAWYLGKPKIMNDLSKVPSDSLISGRDQLIQIEGLSEIDPAIFTSLRNYVHDEVAILLPADQRFDDEDDEF